MARWAYGKKNPRFKIFQKSFLEWGEKSSFLVKWEKFGRKRKEAAEEKKRG